MVSFQMDKAIEKSREMPNTEKKKNGIFTYSYDVSTTILHSCQKKQTTWNSDLERKEKKT